MIGVFYGVALLHGPGMRVQSPQPFLRSGNADETSSARRLGVLHQALPHALFGPAPEAFLGRFGRGDEAGQLGPGAVAPQDGKAGADEPAQRVEVMQVHVRLMPQPRQHTLPQPVLNEMLVQERSA